MGEVTTLIRAAPNVASLRITVAMSVAKQWKRKMEINLIGSGKSSMGDGPSCQEDEIR